MRMRLGVAIMTAAALLTAPWPSRAQVESREGIALQNQIYQLRQELQNLRQQMGRGGGESGPYRPPQAYAPPSSSNDLLAQLLARVDALEEQVRQLRGSADENRYRIDQLGSELSKRIDDLAFQMQSGRPPAPDRAPTAPATARMPPPPPAEAPAAPQPTRRTPELALQEGNAALARRDYAGAEAAAREVLSNYKTSPRAYDAQFLLAQALAGQRQYPQAAIAFDDTYNRARRGAHAPDALLGLANALSAINEKRAACDTIVKLRNEFPRERPDLSDGISAVSQHAGCK